MIGNDKIKERERMLGAMAEAGYFINVDEPIGKLIHEPTKTEIGVYKPISRFKALMLRWCFGLKFEKICF